MSHASLHLCQPLPAYPVGMPTTFGQRLATLRQARGLTQAQFAKAISSSQRIVSYYENHAETAAGNIAVTMARALGVSLDELLGAKPVTKAALQAGPNTDDLRLWRKFQRIRKLPEKDQRAVFRLVNALVGANGADDDAD